MVGTRPAMTKSLKKSYPRSRIRTYLVRQPDRRTALLEAPYSRASCGPPPTRFAVERREAQRPEGGPRKPAIAGRARLGAGLANPLMRRVGSPIARGAQGRRSAAPWRLPALHFPSLGRVRKTGRVFPHPNEWVAERWLSRPRPEVGTEITRNPKTLHRCCITSQPLAARSRGSHLPADPDLMPHGLVRDGFGGDR
jgi:hypothetical protein